MQIKYSEAIFLLVLQELRSRRVGKTRNELDNYNVDRKREREREKRKRESRRERKRDVKDVARKYGYTFKSTDFLRFAEIRNERAFVRRDVKFINTDGVFLSRDVRFNSNCPRFN